MATHSSILAWRIPGTEEPGGLQSIESQRHATEETAHTHSLSLARKLEDLGWVRGRSFVFQAQAKGKAGKRLSCTPGWESHGPLTLTALHLSAGLWGNWSLSSGKSGMPWGLDLKKKKFIYLFGCTRS